MFTKNQLVKQILREYRPASPGLPGFPGTPYQPGRWINQSTRVCQWISRDVQTAEARDNGSRYSVGSSTNSGLYYYSCYNKKTRIYIPEQQARPAISSIPASAEQTIIDYQFGWNAKAHSIFPVENNGAFQFRVPQSTSGAVVGMAVTPIEIGYKDIVFGFYVSSGFVKILESGVEVASLGAHPGALLKITRNSGRIIYDIDGTVVRDRENTTLPVFLKAALYLGGDSVEDAELLTIQSAYGSFPAMVGYAGETAASQAIGFMLPMSGASGFYDLGEAYGSFPPMTGISADASGYAIASGGFLPMAGYAEQDILTPTYAFCDGFMMPMTGAAQGADEPEGGAEVSFLPMVGISSASAYSYAQGLIGPLYGYADEGEREDQAIVFSGFDAGLSLAPVLINFAVIDGNMNVIGMLTVSSVGVAEVMSQFGVSDTYELAQVLRAAIESWMETNTLFPDSSVGRDVWVYHMDAGGSTRYSGYDFTSIKKVGDAYYGVKPDGIYILEGLDDNGVAGPAASVNFGSTNFGTMSKKAIPFVYVGMSSNGDTLLRVTSTGIDAANRPVENTYTYRVRDKTETMKSHRFELGRGLNSTFYGFELVAEGTAFDLHSIEFQPITLTRRL